MDLFGDLPEPGGSAQGKEAQGQLRLFDDLPPAGSADTGKGSSLLFDDLPPAGSSDAASSTPEQVSAGSHAKGEKRKSLEEEEKNGREELVEKKVCKGSVGILGLKGYVAERKGEREDMQDAHVILNDITEECQPLPSQVTRVSYFAVFDGHGGVRASKFAAQNLHLNLIKKFPKGEVVSVEKTVKRCLLDTFKHTDEEFLKQASSQKPAWKDGSTATCVLAVDNILYIANLGDSRAILCRYNEESQKHAALSLSKEHNPTQYEERMRIQKAGGNVRDGRVLGVLEVSRSIGDGQYKRCGVISVPDIKRCQLTHNDRFILIACDGLFKVFTPEEAVNFIVSCLEDKNIQKREGKQEADARYEAACNRLANKAVQRGSADNVTVMVVRIEH
ncbi:integrin-linked kinase-associated serine/threonine phosphatase 2C [Centrocercus urophasianus]|uniref:integrin-linked kinase-associated serine/threonine phosphatase 2C n=1 Tax=Centrocercus urophasianus TaxID=9002 RepID=UPI001C64FF45|nr:integrin-linked kinase-associated serine/threonine phosphatase 2C [Centrocercus urophasianus]XP_042734424.1 integrin-linked kinase-associated serine/threonine phosphatase 2C [Lagopus leucura]XP_048811147.1 integrin-linked kinase-associated serine/threonine phosphatase 2C [Lagopus muta]